MKSHSRLTIFALTLLTLTASLYAQSTLEQFQTAVGDYQKSASPSKALKVIELYNQIDPPPAVPEAAREPFVMGATVLKESKDKADAVKAVVLFAKAVQIAPWWAEARYNSAIALEACGEFDFAISHLNIYLTFKLTEAERRQTQDKIYALKAKAEIAAAKKTETETKQREEQAKANSPQARAEALVASLRKKYSGRLSQHQICGAKLNQYWMSTEAQARDERNWLDHELIGNNGNPRINAVQFNVGGKDGEEIRFSIRSGYNGQPGKTDVWHGKLNGPDLPNVVWAIGETPWKFTFINTTSGKPMITSTYSCGDKGCRRERIIFEEQ